MPIYPKGGGGGTTLPNAETVEKFSEEGSNLLWDGKLVATGQCAVTTETRALTESEISAKRITLAHTAEATEPMNMALVSSTASSLFQVKGIDFTFIEATNQISWDGFGMDGLPVLGDQVYVEYYVRGE